MNRDTLPREICEHVAAHPGLSRAELRRQFERVASCWFDPALAFALEQGMLRRDQERDAYFLAAPGAHHDDDELEDEQPPRPARPVPLTPRQAPPARPAKTAAVPLRKPKQIAGDMRRAVAQLLELGEPVTIAGVLERVPDAGAVLIAGVFHDQVRKGRAFWFTVKPPAIVAVPAAPSTPASPAPAGEVFPVEPEIALCLVADVLRLARGEPVPFASSPSAAPYVEALSLAARLRVLLESEARAL